MAAFKTIVKDRVFQIAAIIAVISLFFARPKMADISFTTLWSLIGMMTVLQIFEHLHVLDFLAYRMTTGANNARQLTGFFVVLSFFAAMFLTNDMAVLTFMPLYLRIARKLKLPEVVPATAIAIAANTGSYMTPFGNTHNIFLMATFHIPLIDFMKWVIPLFIVCALFLAGMLWFVKPIPVPRVPAEDLRINTRLTGFTTVIALIVFASVLDFIPAWVAAIIAIAYSLLVDYKILENVDYAIVFTFAAFFIIVSDIKQVPAVSNLLHTIIHGPTSVYLTSIATSQFISNVPATVLVSQFTHHLAALFYGSNIGGLGTMVASMCNLLAFKQFGTYASHEKRHKFFVPFLVLNFIGLIIIGGLCYFAVLYFD